jgi:hypothetical protein
MQIQSRDSYNNQIISNLCGIIEREQKKLILLDTGIILGPYSKSFNYFNEFARSIIDSGEFTKHELYTFYRKYYKNKDYLKSLIKFLKVNEKVRVTKTNYIGLTRIIKRSEERFKEVSEISEIDKNEGKDTQKFFNMISNIYLLYDKINGLLSNKILVVHNKSYERYPHDIYEIISNSVDSAAEELDKNLSSSIRESHKELIKKSLIKSLYTPTVIVSFNKKQVYKLLEYYYWVFHYDAIYTITENLLKKSLRYKDLQLFEITYANPREINNGAMFECKWETRIILKRFEIREEYGKKREKIRHLIFRDNQKEFCKKKQDNTIA